MAKSEAQKKADRKYDSTHYDAVTVKLPKGTKDRIFYTGMSVNKFINICVLEKLEKMEAAQTYED